MAAGVALAAAGAASAAAPTPASPEGPVWAARPTAQDMELAYPAEAAARQVDGRAMLRCRVAADLTLADCRVASETPEQLGFGASALALTSYFRLASGLEPGQALNLPVSFRYEDSPLGAFLGALLESPDRVDRCAAFSLALKAAGGLPDGEPDWWARYWPARSRVLAEQTFRGDPPGRLDADVAWAAKRLAAGKDRGPLGNLAPCHLK